MYWFACSVFNVQILWDGLSMTVGALCTVTESGFLEGQTLHHFCVATCRGPAQQCFSLTLLQHQLTAISQPTVFFFHTTPATSSSSGSANRVVVGSQQLVWSL